MKKFRFILIFLICTECFSQKDSIVTLYFEFGQFKADTTEKEKLLQLLDRLVTIKGIIGHTDKVGSNHNNLILSRQRSNFVANYITAELLVTIDCPVLYFGESRPLSKVNDAFNRRVDVLLVLQSPSIADISRQTTGSSISRIIRKFSFENVFFVPDKPVIENHSLIAVNDIATQLKHYKNELIEIRGHVNVPLWYKGKKDTIYMGKMQKLSFERAEVIYNILIESGIPAENMTYKGMGNTQMIFPNARTEQQKRKNMRVEVLIFKKE